MTERELLRLQLAEKKRKDPEDKSLPQESELDNMGEKELRKTFRQWNAARHLGELNEQFRDWIVANEIVYRDKIRDILKLGDHKVQLAYYGIIYRVLEYAGSYMMGKNSTPIGITHSKYCEFLALTDRLQSKNVRKAIADDFYGHDYLLTMETRKSLASGEKMCIAPEHVQLEPIYTDLANEINQQFF